MNQLQEMPIDFRLAQFEKQLKTILAEKEKIETESGNYKPHDREKRLKGFADSISLLEKEIQTIKSSLAKNPISPQGVRSKENYVMKPKPNTSKKRKKRRVKITKPLSLNMQIRQLRIQQVAYIKAENFAECQKIGKIINKLKNQ